MVKDAYEDYVRYKRDEEENTRQTNVLGSANYGEKPWRAVAVGSLVRIYRDQPFPADVILAESSNPKGSCYIETKSLDGETNLKLRHTQKDVLEDKRNKGNSFAGKILSENPNNDIHKYFGKISLGGGDNFHPLEADHVVYRGCMLRNTEWIEGIVIFSGHDTKLMQNSAKAKYKFSQLELYANICIGMILSLQFCLALIAALCGTFLAATRETSLSWVEEDRVSGGNKAGLVFQLIGTWILLQTNFVPISLIV